MEIVIGNQQTGATVKFWIEEPEELEPRMVAAFDALRVAQKTGEEHFNANATPEERERRDVYEENARLETERIKKSNAALTQLLAASDAPLQ